ncbi:hypothetical protein PM082_024025 [Marasmius tenuissimus]|nr:hypothetical protein PM082_024025 [Marasmius tenuissimus]
MSVCLNGAVPQKLTSVHCEANSCRWRDTSSTFECVVIWASMSFSALILHAMGMVTGGWGTGVDGTSVIDCGVFVNMLALIITDRCGRGKRLNFFLQLNGRSQESTNRVCAKAIAGKMTFPFESQHWDNRHPKGHWDPLDTCVISHESKSPTSVNISYAAKLFGNTIGLNKVVSRKTSHLSPVIPCRTNKLTSIPTGRTSSQQNSTSALTKNHLFPWKGRFSGSNLHQRVADLVGGCFHRKASLTPINVPCGRRIFYKTKESWGNIEGSRGKKHVGRGVEIDPMTKALCQGPQSSPEADSC